MRRNLFNNTARFFRNSFRGNRSFNTTTTAANKFLIGGIAGILFGSSVLLWKNQNNSVKALENSSAKSAINFEAVRKDIEGLLERPGHDDGSMGPIFVRLAWHASGTYDKATGTGGSNGATMRFAPESEHGANAGLKLAVAALDPIKKKYPGLSYADLWTLAGVVAIEDMGGPTIPWKPGRSDAADGKSCPADGRLPDANKKTRSYKRNLLPNGLQ
jgi:cytochrome c peroxidase